MVFTIFNYDCGVMVMKFMELWDGMARFDGKPCHNIPWFVNLCYCEHCFGWLIYSLYNLLGIFYFQQQMQGFNEEFVGKWILHEDNIKLIEILSKIQDQDKWFTLLTYVVHSTRYLNTYIHVWVGNKQLTTNQPVVYSSHLCGSLSTTFEYIHTCLSWKETTYNKQKIGLLCSPMWFTQHNIWIHTYMSKLETSNLQQTKWSFTLVTYVVHSTWHLDTYIHVSIGNKQFTRNQ